MKTVLAIVAALLLLAGVGYGMYELGWILKEENVNRTSKLNDQSHARQTAIQKEMLQLNRDVRNIDMQLTNATPEQQAPLTAQRRAIVDQFCDAYAGSTGTVTIPQSAMTLANEEC